MKPILITGAAGFIGYHLVRRCIDHGRPVIGIDNLNEYYDVSLKMARLDQLRRSQIFHFEKIELSDRTAMERLFESYGFSKVIHLGAQAGVRYSLTNPHEYTKSNIEGFLNILEGCRQQSVDHLLYASSSSVYGALTQMPFTTCQNVDHPISLYAATKKANELFAHTYSHLYNIPSTGLRFFTVYGPWGRPDMALFLFTRAILAGERIKVFGHGKMKRDFTFIDDVVEAVYRLIDMPATANGDWSTISPDPASSSAPYRLYNIGNSEPVEVLRLIEVLENCLGRKAIKEFLPMQPGDVEATFADTEAISAISGFAPRTSIEFGVDRFVQWFREYYRV